MLFVVCCLLFIVYSLLSEEHEQDQEREQEQNTNITKNNNKNTNKSKTNNKNQFMKVFKAFKGFLMF